MSQFVLGGYCATHSIFLLRIIRCIMTVNIVTTGATAVNTRSPGSPFTQAIAVISVAETAVYLLAGNLRSCLNGTTYNQHAGDISSGVFGNVCIPTHNCQRRAVHPQFAIVNAATGPRNPVN